MANGSGPISRFLFKSKLNCASKENDKKTALDDFITKKSRLLTDGHLPARKDGEIMSIVSSRTVGLVNKASSSSPRLSNLTRKSNSESKSVTSCDISPKLTSKDNATAPDKANSDDFSELFGDVPCNSSKIPETSSKPQTIDEDLSFLSTINWSDEEDFSEALNQQKKNPVNQPETNMPSGFTLGDYVDDDFDITTLGFPSPAPREDTRPKNQPAMSSSKPNTQRLSLVKKDSTVSLSSSSSSGITSSTSLSAPSDAPKPKYKKIYTFGDKRPSRIYNFGQQNSLKPITSTTKVELPKNQLVQRLPQNLTLPVQSTNQIQNTNKKEPQQVPKKPEMGASRVYFSDEEGFDNEIYHQALNVAPLDSPPRHLQVKSTPSGITQYDYADSDFDMSTLDSPGVAPSKYEPPRPSKPSTGVKSDVGPKMAVQIQPLTHAELDLDLSPEAEYRFVPIDKDAKTRRDDTAAFKKTYDHTVVLREILHEKFGLKKFRPNQEEIINAALTLNDCFVLMPTGGGKSLCYQLPAILTPGVTIVISPLRALIVDQVNKLTSLDIPAAHMCADINAATYREIMSQLNQLEPSLKVLYLTPEKIIGSPATFDLLRDLYKRGKLARVVLDEAHCLSQWGHDFRPDYKQLTTMRVNFPKTPIMCLTATATNVVQQDVTNVLNLKNVKTFIRSFNRPNIKYAVLEKTAASATDAIIKLIKQKFTRMSGIVYCLSRKDCDKMAVDLSKVGITAKAYHAGLSDKQREKVQGGWMNNEYHVICATIAFGMGIDKPDVRFVIHNSLPKSVEAFYQESGRGGRDGELSYSYLFYRFSDVIKLQKLIQMDKSMKRSNLEAHFDQINQMAQYAENKTDCRRYLQLAHLGEKFDRRRCIRDRRTICDNCVNYGSVTEQDVTKESRELATLVKELNARRNFTMLHYVDVYRGSGLKKIMDNKHNMHKYYGAGKHLNKNDVHRIMKELHFKKVFQDKAENYGQFPIIYVVPGPNFQCVFDASNVITIPVNKPSGARMAAPSWPEEPEEPEREAVASTSTATKPTTNNAAKKPKTDNTQKIHSTKIKCHEELLEKCAQFAAMNASTLSSVMNLAGLKEMADNLPHNEQQFMKTQYVTKANFEKYGKEFLLITQKYRRQLDELELADELELVKEAFNNVDSDEEWSFGSPQQSAAPSAPKKTWTNANARKRNFAKFRKDSGKYSTSKAKYKKKN